MAEWLNVTNLTGGARGWRLEAGERKRGQGDKVTWEQGENWEFYLGVRLIDVSS